MFYKAHFEKLVEDSRGFRLEIETKEIKIESLVLQQHIDWLHEDKEKRR